MAYKFQLGPAVMSGTLEQEGSVDITESGVLKIAGSTLADASRNITAVQVSGSSHLLAGGNLTVAGNMLLTGSATLAGVADTAMTATDGMYFRDADGTMKRDAASDVRDLFFSAVSGDATVAAGGALTIAASAVHHGMLNDDVISGQSELAHADIADADELMISDAGVVKRVGVDSLRDHFFGVVSGDATVADGGALTIANDAVEQAMIADDAVGADQLAADAVVNASVVDGALKADKLDIDGSTDIGADLVDADLMLVDDGAGGTNRKSTLTRVKKYIYSAMSGDATASDAGALTISANAVEGSMLNSNVVADTLQYSGSALRLSSSVAGAGVGFSSGVLSLDIDELSALGGTGVAQGDHFVFSDDGTEKKITFSNMEDAIFGNVSSDATIAAGGAMTIANDAITSAKIATGAVVADGLGAAAVEHGALNDNIISGQDELAHADIVDADELMISDGGVVKRVGVDSLRDHFFGVVSGDATVADGGALTIAANAVQDSMLNDDVATGLAGAGLSAASGVLALDLNELTAESIASGDFLPFEDSTDNGSHKITIDNLATFMAGDGVDASGGKLSVAGSTVSGTGDSDETLIEGFNYQNTTLTADRTWTLPAPGGLDAGSIVRVKAGNLDGNKITVARNTSTIDGVAADLELEANGAAISLMYIGGSNWQLF